MIYRVLSSIFRPDLNFASVAVRLPVLPYTLWDFQVIARRRKYGSGNVETDRRVESKLSRYSNPSRVFWVGCIRDCGTQSALSPRNTVAEGAKIMPLRPPKCFISLYPRSVHPFAHFHPTFGSFHFFFRSAAVERTTESKSNERDRSPLRALSRKRPAVT